MGAPGRKYVEKMIEGVTTLNLAGNLTVAGDTDASGGTLLYKTKLEVMAVNTTLTEADSGKIYGVTANNVTASLPNASDLATQGIHYTFVLLLPVTNHNFTLTSSVGGVFAGHIQGGGGAAVVATGVADTRMKATLAYASDRFHVVSSGIGHWVLLDASGVDNTKWSFTTS